MAETDETREERAVTVVVPVRDEGANVLPLIREIKQALEGRVRYEVIYVDDGSRDDTLERLLEARREVLPGLRVVRHASSRGQSAAIRTGVLAARFPWIVTLDGDGQNDPADVPSLLALLDDPSGAPALVCGLRKVRHDSLVKRVSSRIANGVRQRLLKDGIGDTGCGLKVVSRETFLRLPAFDHMHRFLPALVQRAGGSVRAIDVSHRPRSRGDSKYGTLDRLWVGLVDLVGVRWLQRRACDGPAEELGPVQAPDQASTGRPAPHEVAS